MEPQTKDYASGNWVVQPGRETDFVKAWDHFLGWTRAEAPGLRWAMLVRDAADSRHFVSMAEWESQEALLAWRSMPAFVPNFTACRALCEDFQGSNYQLIATA